MSDDEAPPAVPHYDRNRALAEALDVAVGRGGGEVDVSQITPGTGDGTTGGEMVSRVEVPAWAARSWQICLSPPTVLGLAFPTNPAQTVITWYSASPVRVVDLRYPTPLPLLARVAWGQGGAHFVADVTWFNGGSFVVHGSYVELRAVLISPWGTGIPSPATVKVRGAITPAESNGRRAGPPMLATAPQLFAPGESFDFLVPMFARSARIVRHAGPNNFPTLEIAQYADTAHVNNCFFEIVTAGASNMVAARAAERMFPIAANAKVFTIRSMEATLSCTFHLEWELDLG